MTGKKALSMLFNPLDDTVGPKAILGGKDLSVSGPGGIAAQRPDDNAFVTNPDGTRTYASNGQTFAASGTGFVPVANPNLAQQTGANLNRAAGFYGQAPGYDTREQGAYDMQGGLANHLNGIIAGTGPTVAGGQMVQGQEALQRAQLAQAAGASGGNAALMRMGAMSNTAGGQAQTNQAAALERAQEQRDALGALGGLTGNMAQESEGMAGQKIAAGNALSGLGTTSENDLESLQQKAQSDNQAYEAQRSKNMMGGGGAALMALI